MYLLILDGRAYPHDPRDRTRTPFTLVSALDAARGCGGATVARADGTPVVTGAGSDAGPLTYAPTGRKVYRRLTWRARERYEAEMAAHTKRVDDAWNDGRMASWLRGERITWN